MMQGLKIIMLATVATGVTAKRVQPQEQSSSDNHTNNEYRELAPKTAEKKSSKQAVAQVRQGQSRQPALGTKGQSSFVQPVGDAVEKDSNNTKSVKQQTSTAGGQGNSASEKKTCTSGGGGLGGGGGGLGIPRGGGGLGFRSSYYSC